MIKPLVLLGGTLVVIYVAFLALIFLLQRQLIYFPTHSSLETPLKPWVVEGQVLGYHRTVANPRTVWLMLHGNAGQASQRAYVLARMSPADALYVVEYPGYGLRSGAPSRISIDAAAVEAYDTLKLEFPNSSLGVIGESIGSGPASLLCTLPNAPDKIILIVPFDSLASVAAARFSFLPVRSMLRDDWDNIRSLRGYRGTVVIYAATNDTIIPVKHARNLASNLPTATLVEIDGGHNDWSESDLVRIY